MWKVNQLDDHSEQVGVSEHAGFPNAATDRSLSDLDLHQLLIKRPASTFFMIIEGNGWEEQGIFNGDLAIIDRGLSPQKTDKLIWWVGDSFVIGGQQQMPPDATNWGVVIVIIHRYRT